MGVERHQRFPLTAGIVGGLGPHAHIWLERRLLELAAARFGAAGDTDYPQWAVVSMPQTPDRTAALLADGPDPTPYLQSALAKLKAAGADFAAIACNTMHAFLPRLTTPLPLPVIHVITETASRLAREYPAVRRVGLLATTGFCRSGLLAVALTGRAVVICPDDDEQDRLVMSAIYGRADATGRRAGGIKAGLIDTPDATGSTPRQLLGRACDRLAEAGAEIVVVACSEISLAVRPGQGPLPVVDTMDVLAEAMLDLASGRRPLSDPAITR